MRHLSIVLAHLLGSCALLPGQVLADGMVILDGGRALEDYVQQAPRVGADGRIYVILAGGGACGVAVLDADGSFSNAFGQSGTRTFSGQCLVDVDPDAPEGIHTLRTHDVQRVDSALDPFWTSPAYMAALPHGTTGGGSNTAFIRLPDGKILAAGKHIVTAMGGLPSQEWTLARITTSGELDTTFNAGAVLRQSPANSTGLAHIASLHLLAGEQVLATGRVQPSAQASVYETMLSRYNPNGTIDYSFGANGELRFADTTGQSVFDSSGRLYLAGRNGRVTRLTSTFSVDSGYAGGADHAQLEIFDIALDSSDRVVVFGLSDLAGPGRGYVARFDTSGAPDATFNGTGVAHIAFPGLAINACRGSLQPDGKPLLACAVASQADAGATPPIDFAVVRLTTGGALDVSFGAQQADADAYPDGFSFPGVTVGYGAVNVEAAPVTLTGFTARAEFSVHGNNSSYSVGCTGSWVTPGSGDRDWITPGQSLCIRQDAPPTPSSSVTAVVNVGGRLGNFVVSSSATPADIVPDAFSFESRTGIARHALVESNAIQISGIAGRAPLAVVNGEWSLGCNGSFFSSPTQVTNGQTLCVRHTAADAFTTSKTTTLTIGGVQGTFVSTTGAADTTPNGFLFVDLSDVTRDTIIISNPITISGINADTSISITGGEYSVGCNTTYSSAPGTVIDGQVVCVRHTSAATAGATVRTRLNIGGVSDEFATTTAAVSSGGSSGGGAALPPGGGGGGGAFEVWTLLGLLSALGLGRRRALPD